MLLRSASLPVHVLRLLFCGYTKQRADKLTGWPHPPSLLCPQLSCLAYYSLSSRQFYLARLQLTHLVFLHEADLHPVMVGLCQAAVMLRKIVPNISLDAWFCAADG